MQRITTFLTFNDQAEEAVKFYTSIFKNSKIIRTARYPDSMGEMAGRVMTVTFEIEGQEFVALNGGPSFTFSQGISLMVNCKDQAEIDDYWTKLSAGGQEVQCGWLTDKFGVSWQVTPIALMHMISDPDSQKADRAMQAMMRMVKLDLPALERAFEGE